MYHKNEIPDQEQGEQLILFVRRDLFILFKTLVVYSFLAVLPLAIWFGAQAFAVALGEILTIVATLVVFSYYLIVLVLFYRAFLDYYLDVWIVTTQRVINIEQEDLFHRTIAEVRLSKVQDVTSQSKGFFATFFDYGEVFVQSAGETPRIVFEEVPEPQRVAKVVADLVRLKNGHV